MYPHERSLVKKLQMKPFALLGINVGDSPFDIRKLIAEGQITWRFWLDKGSIAGAWGVQMYPDVYVLDHKGIIRYRFDRDPGQKLDQVVDQLLKELERERISEKATGETHEYAS